MNRMNLISLAQACLQLQSPSEKVARTRDAYRRLQAGELAIDPAVAGKAFDQPGRPDKPVLVEPRDLPRRSLSTSEGQAALIHSIAHIEFNAINLAWDAVCRFADMPENFYRDWARVADEEAYHFSLLAERLRNLGYQYGDYPAHNGLWEAALDTRHDVLIRMALVPRVLEARGLDVTPGIMQKLERAGDHRTIELLKIILRDEIGHVEIGTRWFRYCCEQRGLDPDATFEALLKQYMKGRIKGPFYYEARVQAGFSDNEMATLEHLDAAAGDR